MEKEKIHYFDSKTHNAPQNAFKKNMRAVHMKTDTES
jgi:hypothetical protein